MGLFDGLKNKKENVEAAGFCRCGNLTQNKYCGICSSFIDDDKRLSNEFNQFWLDEVIIPLSEKYNEDFDKTPLRNYFNLESKQENHIIYRLKRAIVLDEVKGDICDFFEGILDETKNLEDVEKTIMDNIKSDIVSKFYNGGYAYSRSSVLTDAYAEMFGIDNTVRVKQSSQSNRKFHERKFVHFQYSFDPDSIVIKSYPDKYISNSFNPEKAIAEWIISWNEISHVGDDYSFILESGDEIQLIPPILADITNINIFNVVGTIIWELNESLQKEHIININDKTRLLLIKLIKQYIDTIKS